MKYREFYRPVEEPKRSDQVDNVTDCRSRGRQPLRSRAFDGMPHDANGLVDPRRLIEDRRVLAALDSLG
ncbi:MAG: hypothetical protein ACE5G5_12065, partial [Candidatus Methylomirabilales bacterium]